MHGKSYPLVMGLLLLFFFFNLNQKKTKIKKQTNKKLKSSAISYPGKLGTRLKCVGAKSQGPTLNFIFRWMDTSAICILGTHRMSFIFCACTRIDIQFERSRVQQYDPFRHWFYYGLYDVGLHLPGNILLHSLSLYCFHCTRKRPVWDLRKNNFPLSWSGYFPLHDDMQISLTMFLIDGTILLPVTRFPNQKNKQTIKTNE